MKFQYAIQTGKVFYSFYEAVCKLQSNKLHGLTQPLCTEGAQVTW